MSEASEIGGDTSEFNCTFCVAYPGRRGRTAVWGRWRGGRVKFSQGRKFLKARGVLEESRNLKKLFFIKMHTKFFKPSRFQGKSLFMVPKQR